MTARVAGMQATLGCRAALALEPGTLVRVIPQSTTSRQLRTLVCVTLVERMGSGIMAR